VRGPAFLLAGIGLFCVLDANNKLLSGQFGLGQVTVIRYLVLIGLFLAARAVVRDAFGPVTTARPRLHLIRAASMMVSVAGFFLGFRYLPLAEGYLVFFTGPFLTLALAALVLKERVPAASWAWCAVGFAGVLIAVAPKLGAGAGAGGDALLGYAAILMGTLAFAVTQTVNRQLRGEPGIARILFWPSIAGILLYGPFALQGWVQPGPVQFAMLALSGLLAGAAVVCTALAFRTADAARLGPYNYAALPFAVLLDLAIWGKPPDPMTILGGAVVVAACVLSERARRRAMAAAQGISAGKRCVPSAPRGSGVTPRTAESGSGP
jgi:drug/metabolite transporter (DMT)-like permease